MRRSPLLLLTALLAACSAGDAGQASSGETPAAVSAAPSSGAGSLDSSPGTTAPTGAAAPATTTIGPDGKATSIVGAARDQASGNRAAGDHSVISAPSPSPGAGPVSSTAGGSQPVAPAPVPAPSGPFPGWQVASSVDTSRYVPLAPAFTGDPGYVSRELMSLGCLPQDAGTYATPRATSAVAYRSQTGAAGASVRLTFSSASAASGWRSAYLQLRSSCTNFSPPPTTFAIEAAGPVIVARTNFHRDNSRWIEVVAQDGAVLKIAQLLDPSDAISTSAGQAIAAAI